MKTIELIDKYRIEHPEISEYNSYNPPNYIWTDNTGEIVRCRDCKYWYPDADTGMACKFTSMSQPEDGYCNWGERKNG